MILMHKTFGTIIFNTVETFQLEHLILFLVSVCVLFGKKLRQTHAWEKIIHTKFGWIWKFDEYETSFIYIPQNLPQIPICH